MSLLESMLHLTATLKCFHVFQFPLLPPNIEKIVIKIFEEFYFQMSLDTTNKYKLAQYLIQRRWEFVQGHRNLSVCVRWTATACRREEIQHHWKKLNRILHHAIQRWDRIWILAYSFIQLLSSRLYSQMSRLYSFQHSDYVLKNRLSFYNQAIKLSAFYDLAFN